MSPDQRWIAYRKPYPPHGMELPVSEEYLLYDLSRSPTQNRAAGVALDDHGDVGVPIFPPGQMNIPGDHIGLPDDQLHSAASNLFWSPESKAVVFADELLGRFSLVLVKINSSGATTAFVYSIDGLPAERPARCSGNSNSYPLSRVEFGPEQGADRLMFAEFAAGCTPQRLQLHLSDFRPAKAEVHAPTRYTRKAVKAEP